MRPVFAATAVAVFSLTGCGSHEDPTSAAPDPTPVPSTWSELGAAHSDVLGFPGCDGAQIPASCMTTMTARLGPLRDDAAGLPPSPALAALLSAIEAVDRNTAVFVGARCGPDPVDPACAASVADADAALDLIQMNVHRQVTAGR